MASVVPYTPLKGQLQLRGASWNPPLPKWQLCLLPISPFRHMYEARDVGPSQPHRCPPRLSVLPTDGPKDTQVSVSPSTQNIRMGDTVSLTCEVSSSYPAISAYHWFKDGVVLASERVLTLRDVRREDYGQYHCEANNAVGAGVAPAVTLYIFCECQGSLPRAGALLDEELEGVYLVSPDWGGQRPALRWLVPPGDPGAGETTVEDCDASITPCQHPSSCTVACPKDRPGRDFQPSLGFPALCCRCWEGACQILQEHRVRVVCGERKPGPAIRACSKDKP